jgi:hypothetical protein
MERSDTAVLGVGQSMSGLKQTRDKVNTNATAYGIGP